MYSDLGFVEVPLHDGETEWADSGCRIIRMELKKN
jgi:hypothetical protein